MSLPALPKGADARAITERVNVLIREYNLSDPMLVADLPPIADVKPGTRAMVSDASGTTFHAQATGGGTNMMPVYADTAGAKWRYG